MDAAAFRAAGQTLENSEEGLCFLGKQTGQGSVPQPFLMSEWPSPSLSLPGRGHGVEGT